VSLLQLVRQALTDTSEPPKASETDDDFVEPEKFDEEAEIERRRKRREALLAKSSSATPLLLHAVGASDKVRGLSPGSQGSSTLERPESEAETPRSSKCTAA
jgi:serine/threonine-protein kinase PRP4